MKELGWFHRPDSYLDIMPNWYLTIFARDIMQSKVQASNYARSNERGARLLAEEYAKSATEYESHMSNKYWSECNYVYYRKDSNGMYTRTVQDEVIEVTTEEELKDRYSSCINYIKDFMRVYNAKNNLTFQ